MSEEQSEYSAPSPSEALLVSELIEGENLFDSRGYSIVKTTKAGVEAPRKLPIKSTGVAEFMERLGDKAPRPPVTFEFIKKNSPEGREMGLTHDRKVAVFDATDEKYVDALNHHNQEFSWQVAVFALDLKWVRKDGTEASTYEEKKQILRSNGITGHQINQIFDDVKALTAFEEGERDFLPGN